MSETMWGGRFDLPMDHLVEEFNATILIEKRVTPFPLLVARLTFICWRLKGF